MAREQGGKNYKPLGMESKSIGCTKLTGVGGV